ncbi:MAG: LUD domain-containing protein, partial [Chloroflexi bacterium]|nr:LUD domain-containing protein [Chloroflexota bacterium]
LNERLSRPDFYELSLEERAQIHRRAIVGDFYVTSVHAITRGGQLVLLNGSGNSIAALSYAAARVYVVAGHNKLVGTLEEALVRARHVAAVMNSRRLGRANPCVVDGICHDESCELPDRLCNKTLIVDREELIGRIQVVLVGEVLGF